MRARRRPTWGSPRSDLVLYRLIVYDLDGTLVDTLEDLTQSANHMLAACRRPPVSPEALKGYVGLGLPTLVRRCLGTEDPELTERGMGLYRAHYQQHLLDHSRLYPRVQELLEHFRDRWQAILTNKPEAPSRRILEGLGVAGSFQAVVGGDSGFPHKPDPAGLRSVMARAGVPAGQTLLIGDSPVDVQTGRAAGVRTVVVAQGFAGVDELQAAGAQELAAAVEDVLTLARRDGW